MNKFREKVPQKTSSDEAYDEYGKYKHVLNIDFYGNCGYCNDNDFYMGGWRCMQIDHFAPVRPFKEVEHTYENLVYSCFYCNNAKSNDWVTNKADQPINEARTEGYVHPREYTYANLFKRSRTGSILPENSIGLYIYTNLNLGLKRHELICTMERITKIVGEINCLLENPKIAPNVRSILNSNKVIFLDNKDIIERQFREIINAK